MIWKKKTEASKILFLLNIESSELKNPWLNGELQISKKSNYINTTISSNVDSLILDSLIESKLNLK